MASEKVRPGNPCPSAVLHNRPEHRANHLWIPPGSEFNVREAWLAGHFRTARRDEIVTVAGDNVLTPAGLGVLLRVHEAVLGAAGGGGAVLADICTRVPVTEGFGGFGPAPAAAADEGREEVGASRKGRRRRRQAADDNATAAATAVDYDYVYDYDDYAWDDDDDGWDDYYEGDGGAFDYAEHENRSHQLDVHLFCDTVNSLQRDCLVSSLLQVSLPF